MTLNIYSLKVLVTYRHLKLAATLKIILAMIVISMAGTSPVFYFTKMRSFMEIETNIPDINLCYEEWPVWLKQTYKIAANIGYILLPAIVVVSLICHI